ncbi:MAG: PA2169 family four-helix-bundle protein [Bacteroidia bacterium]
METVKEVKSVDALKELIVINNDRYEGYKTASKETKDPDYKALFAEFSLQSKRFGDELRKLIPFTEETPDRDETKASGKVYRVWMDVKAALTANDTKSILASCEFGEDVALKTYNDVLEEPEEISSELLELIKKQRAELQKSHDLIKAKRDMV